MPVAAKVRPTKKVAKITLLKKPGSKPLTFRVPAHAVRPIELFIKQVSNGSGSIPAESVFPELASDTERPAAVLRGSRYKEGMTQNELSAKLGIKQSHLSEMESSKRSIGKKMAKTIKIPNPAKR